MIIENNKMKYVILNELSPFPLHDYIQKFGLCFGEDEYEAVFRNYFEKSVSNSNSNSSISKMRRRAF